MIETILENWSYVLVFILAIDKVVALSPSKWDDLLWTAIRKAIFKVLKK